MSDNGGHLKERCFCSTCCRVCEENAVAMGAKEEQQRLRALGPFLDPGCNDRTDVYNLAHEAGRKQGAKEATAAIVAWLTAEGRSLRLKHLESLAAMVAAGDHLKPGEPR